MHEGTYIRMNHGEFFFLQMLMLPAEIEILNNSYFVFLLLNNHDRDEEKKVIINFIQGLKFTVK